MPKLDYYPAGGILSHVDNFLVKSCSYVGRGYQAITKRHPQDLVNAGYALSTASHFVGHTEFLSFFYNLLNIFRERDSQMMSLQSEERTLVASNLPRGLVKFARAGLIVAGGLIILDAILESRGFYEEKRTGDGIRKQFFSGTAHLFTAFAEYMTRAEIKPQA
ncbi:hypothetical protein CMO91_00630 [Candidatus Woesearchaeota archaeon]|nr:hypothetical protein [Candidatus Woesearchaeota archaeon]|tara:strand:+ start:511 stop:999 length:489 start_codon:yes stop_codon:yes gene_type:complete